MSAFHLNTITKDHEFLMDKLGDLVKNQLLIGGTALSLQIGHRRSDDLDFVIPRPVPKDIVEQIKAKVGNFKIEHLIRTEQQYTGYVGKVKITFFYDPVKFLYPTHKLLSTQLVNVKDIFSSKLYVLSKRAAWRDYIDIAILLDKGLVDLRQGIKEAKIRYQINEKWILEPLTYFDDIAYQPIKFVGKQFSNEQIQQIISQAVKGYLSLTN